MSCPQISVKSSHSNQFNCTILKKVPIKLYFGLILSLMTWNWLITLMPSLKGLVYWGFIRFYLQMRPCQPDLPTLQDRQKELEGIMICLLIWSGKGTVPAIPSDSYLKLEHLADTGDWTRVTWSESRNVAAATWPKDSDQFYWLVIISICISLTPSHSLIPQIQPTQVNVTTLLHIG